MKITENDALLLIDLQNDFAEGGTLAAPNTKQLFPKINALTERYFDLIIASRDWHPKTHCSFQENGGPWATHCVAGTKGAEFSPLLDITPLSHIIHKGRDEDTECYSAFFDENHKSTGLTSLLNDYATNRVFIAGIALEYCVKATALDAKKQGFETIILADYCASFGESSSLLQQLEKKEQIQIYYGELL